MRYTKGVHWNKENFKSFLEWTKIKVRNRVKKNLSDPFFRQRPQLRPGFYAMMMALLSTIIYSIIRIRFFLFITVIILIVKFIFIDSFTSGYWMDEQKRMREQKTGIHIPTRKEIKTMKKRFNP
ncbi:MAG: hypothetical protein AABY22_33960 [Nanoarchaeota archaeon]|mgnify:CR=1 FL=1